MRRLRKRFFEQFVFLILFLNLSAVRLLPHKVFWGGSFCAYWIFSPLSNESVEYPFVLLRWFITFMTQENIHRLPPVFSAVLLILRKRSLQDLLLIRGLLVKEDLWLPSFGYPFSLTSTLCWCLTSQRIVIFLLVARNWITSEPGLQWKLFSIWVRRAWFLLYISQLLSRENFETGAGSIIHVDNIFVEEGRFHLLESARGSSLPHILVLILRDGCVLLEVAHFFLLIVLHFR